MTDRRILITGHTGQLGSVLARLLSPHGTVIAPSRDELDLANIEAIKPFVRAHQPHLIVNCGAYTAVDSAETDPQLAHQVNAAAPEALATSAHQIGASLIQISTDYVFDGEASAPYLESDTTHPINVYGQSKLDGEVAVLNGNPETTVVRVAWLYHTEGRNFLLTMLRLAEKHAKLRIVNDQFGAPTYVVSLAEALEKLCKLHLQGAPPLGVFHLPAGGQASWHEFAECIFRMRSKLAGLPSPELIGIPSTEYPTPAARPKYSVLSGDKSAAELGLSLPHWRSQLERAMAVLFPNV